MTHALSEHLKTGITHVCHLWTVTRRDGEVLGFTDHDCDLIVAGVTHHAGSGLNASALQQATGLSVDNSEVVGALSDAAITESDLNVGRFDGAEIRIWLADWQVPEARRELFRGTLGEVIRRGASFRAELRGLAEPLGQPVGFAYGRSCSAVLGDGRCGFDPLRPGFYCDIPAGTVSVDGRDFLFDALPGFAPGWFTHGRLEVTSGGGRGLAAMIRSDETRSEGRRVRLWQGIAGQGSGARILPGDALRLYAGCDKQSQTCKMKFENLNNFRGFPHLPDEDWLTAYPRQDRPAGGGSRLAFARLVGGT